MSKMQEFLNKIIDVLFFFKVENVEEAIIDRLQIPGGQIDINIVILITFLFNILFYFLLFYLVKTIIKYIKKYLKRGGKEF